MAIDRQQDRSVAGRSDRGPEEQNAKEQSNP